MGKGRLLSIPKELAGVPGVLEIVWGLQIAERRVLDADNFFRRRQKEIGWTERRSEDDIAAIGSIGDVHFEAGKGGAGQRVVQDARLNDLPERPARCVGHTRMRGKGECRADA